MLVLSEDDVERLLDLEALLDVVADAFEKQGAGAVERPERPHFELGAGLGGGGPTGTGLVMPAYLHGSPYNVTKIVGVHPGNSERGLDTVQAQVVLSDAATGEPVAFVAGNPVTNARTGCIGGLAVRELAAEGRLTVGMLGAGTQARWQARCIAAAADLAEVRVFSPGDSRETCARELTERGLAARAVGSPAEALAGADVVVAATTSSEPVFEHADLEAPLVVGIGAYTAQMQELPAATIEAADRVWADVPDEVAEIGDLQATGLERGDLAPFAEALGGRDARPDGLAVVESVGSAVLDAATAEHLLRRAEKEDAGTRVPVLE